MAISKYSKKLIKERIAQLKETLSESDRLMTLYSKKININTDDYNYWKSVNDKCKEELDAIKKDAEIVSEAEIEAIR